jgi:hypothetical protein
MAAMTENVVAPAAQGHFTNLAGFADELLRALVCGDLDHVTELFDRQGRFRCGPLGLDGTWAEVRPTIERNQQRIGTHQHVGVSRMYGGDAFVDRHTAHWTNSDGSDGSVEVMVHARVRGSGSPDDPLRVIHFEEFFDPAGVPAPARDADATRRIVQRHVDSEFTNDVPSILATVSEWDVFFPQFTDSPAGHGVIAALDRAGARTFYETTRELFNAVRSTSLIGIYTPWYALRASIGEVQPAADPERGVFASQSVTIFPVAPDGIIGEISWLRDPLVDLFEGRAKEDPLPREARLQRNAALFAEYLDAWTTGRSAEAAALIADPCCWVRRTVQPATGSREYTELLEHAAVVNEYANEPMTAYRVKVVNQIVETYYVFAEFVLEPVEENGPEPRRMAALYPVSPDGLFVGELSYVVVGPDFRLG